MYGMIRNTTCEVTIRPVGQASFPLPADEDTSRISFSADEETNRLVTMLVGDRDRGRSALLPLDITCLLADASKSGQLSDKRMKRWRHVICLMAHQQRGRAEPSARGMTSPHTKEKEAVWLCAGGNVFI